MTIVTQHQNFSTCDKLDYHKIGPFHIEKQINTVASQLNLPTLMKIYLVFYVLLLETYWESNFPGRIQPPSPIVVINDHEKYEVEEFWIQGFGEGKLNILFIRKNIQLVNVHENLLQT